MPTLIESEMPVSEIADRGHDIETIVKIWEMLDAAEYKRRQAPPGIRISSKAFGAGRRFPIVNHYQEDTI